jgi:hypothetical protein
MLEVAAALYQHYLACIDEPIAAAPGVPLGYVYETARWQLEGVGPYVNAPVALEDLQMPEFFSGCPWEHGAHWIAFVAINPSFSAHEIYPTRGLFLQAGAVPMVNWHRERFEPGFHAAPLIHGRGPAPGAGPAVWFNGAPEQPPIRQRQPTWSALDWATRECFGQLDVQRAQAPLGRAAAIFDLVPWKARNWSRIPAPMRDELVIIGAQYLMEAFEVHPPTVIIACGEDTRRGMQAINDQGIPAYAPGHQQGHFRVGGVAIPWFGVRHPVARGAAFNHDIQAIAPLLAPILAA